MLTIAKQSLTLISLAAILQPGNQLNESKTMTTLYTKTDLAHAKACMTTAQREFAKVPSASNWAKVTSRMEQYQTIWARLLEEKESIKLWQVA